METTQTTRPTNAAQRLARIHTILDTLRSSPASHDLIDLAMASAVSVGISTEEDSPLVWLLVVGPPSSGKTDAVFALRQDPAVKFLDTLTPEAFVSGLRHPKSGTRAKDLLPELDGKCLVIKDMTTLFSLRDDKVRKVLGDLQSIYDGEFSKATGSSFEPTATIEHRSRFALVGCVTPEAVARHQRHMAQIGSRFLVYRVPRLTPQQVEAGFDRLVGTGAGKALRDELRRLVLDHLREAHDAWRRVRIPAEDEHMLRDLAVLVQRGRTPILWERTTRSDDDGRVRTGHEPVLGTPEEPFRVYQQLCTLLRALTAVALRTTPTRRELEVVRRVALSSVLPDRAEVLDVLHRRPVVWRQTVTADLDGEREELEVEWWGLTVPTCALGIRRDMDQVRNRLEEMVRIGLMVKGPNRIKGGAGRPQTLYRPVPRFEGLMLGEFDVLSAWGSEPVEE